MMGSTIRARLPAADSWSCGVWGSQVEWEMWLGYGLCHSLPMRLWASIELAKKFILVFCNMLRKTQMNSLANTIVWSIQASVFRSEGSGWFSWVWRCCGLNEIPCLWEPEVHHLPTSGVEKPWWQAEDDRCVWLMFFFPGPWQTPHRAPIGCLSRGRAGAGVASGCGSSAAMLVLWCPFLSFTSTSLGPWAQQLLNKHCWMNEWMGAAELQCGVSGGRWVQKGWFSGHFSFLLTTRSRRGENRLYLLATYNQMQPEAPVCSARDWKRPLPLIQGKEKWGEVRVPQSCPTLCDPMDYGPPGSSVYGILQARILEWVAIPFSRGSSRPRDRIWVSRIAGRFFTIWATGEEAHIAARLPRAGLWDGSENRTWYLLGGHPSWDWLSVQLCAHLRGGVC